MLGGIAVAALDSAPVAVRGVLGIVAGALPVAMFTRDMWIGQRTEGRATRGEQREVLGKRDRLNDEIWDLQQNGAGSDDSRLKGRIEHRDYLEAVLAGEKVLDRAPTTVSVERTADELSEDEITELRQLLDASQTATRDLRAGEWWLRGNAEFAVGEYEEALAAYDRAIELDPDHAVAHLNRGPALARLERYKEALAACDRAIELDPSHAGAHTNRGVVLARLERYKEALSAFDRAIELDPDNLVHHYNRACGLAMLQRPEAALAALSTALEHGFDNCALLESDPDLAPLRTDPEFAGRFEQLVARCREARDGPAR